MTWVRCTPREKAPPCRSLRRAPVDDTSLQRSWPRALRNLGSQLLVYNHGTLAIMRLLVSLGLLLPLFAPAQTASPKKAFQVPVPQTPAPRFKDVAKEAGLTVSHISTPEKKYIVESMSGGAGLIDCDDDGKLDIITVNGSTIDRFRQGGDPMITLYHQEADFKFSDITKIASLARKGWGMGVAVADYDNDGLSDIYVTGYGGNALYHNLGNCKFEDVTEKAGVAAGGFSTGAAWADYDKDGRVDLFVAR